MSLNATIAIVAILAAVIIGHLLGDRNSKGRASLIIAVVIAVVVFSIAGWDHITSLFEVVRLALHLHK